MKNSELIKTQVVAAFKGEHGSTLLDGDGHSIMAPKFYIEMGIPAEFVEPLEYTHTSDLSSHKGTITLDGEIQEQVVGVYNLIFLGAVAALLGVDHKTAVQFGRGSRAREYCRVIKEAIL